MAHYSSSDYKFHWYFLLYSVWFEVFTMKFIENAKNKNLTRKLFEIRANIAGLTCFFLSLKKKCYFEKICDTKNEKQRIKTPNSKVHIICSKRRHFNGFVIINVDLDGEKTRHRSTFFIFCWVFIRITCSNQTYFQFDNSKLTTSNWHHNIDKFYFSFGKRTLTHNIE